MCTQQAHGVPLNVFETGKMAKNCQFLKFVLEKYSTKNTHFQHIFVMFLKHQKPKANNKHHTKDYVYHFLTLIETYNLFENCFDVVFGEKWSTKFLKKCGKKIVKKLKQNLLKVVISGDFVCNLMVTYLNLVPIIFHLTLVNWYFFHLRT